MEYINFGKVENVSTSVPVAADDTVYHIIIDFVPNCPEIFDSFHTDMGKILECPDDYVLCNVSDIVKAQDELLKLKDRVKELETEKNTWKEKCGSVITDTFRVLSSNPFGVKFNFDGWNEDGNWLITMDFPELDEAKKKISELESKLEDSKSNETYWRNRKNEEEDYHHYWLHTYNLAVAHAANEGVRIFITGDDKENNVGVISVKNEKVEELEKELDDLKSKKITKCTLDPSDGKLTFIYTYMDGHSESTCIIDDIDPNGIPRDVTPKCKSCAHHVSGSRSADVWCHKPVSKKGPGIIRRLSTEEAEGPACDKFEAKKGEDWWLRYLFRLVL